MNIFRKSQVLLIQYLECHIGIFASMIKFCHFKCSGLTVKRCLKNNKLHLILLLLLTVYFLYFDEEVVLRNDIRLY